MEVIKRNGSSQPFNWDKIENVLRKAFEAVGKTLSDEEYYNERIYFCRRITRPNRTSII